MGIPSRFIDLAHQINLELPSYFAGVATGKLGTLNKSILLFGVAYKPNVADIRQTPAIGLINVLRQVGAEVWWHDDLVQTLNGESSVALTNAHDLAILVNPHSYCDVTLLGATPVLNTRGGY